MKFAYVIVCLILSLSLFAANCSAAKSCKNGQCSTPQFRTLELTIPVTAVVAPAPTVREDRIVQKATVKESLAVAVAPVKAAIRIAEAVREREHKPVVRLVQAIRERERRPVAIAISAIRERKPLRSLMRR